MRVRRKYKHAVEDRDRHGNVRVYLHLPGQRKIRLRQMPGTPEFDAEYREAMAGKIKPAAPRRLPTPAVGSLSALCMAQVEGQGFHLTGSAGLDLHLVRADEAAFQAAAPCIRQQSDAIIIPTRQAELQQRAAILVRKRADLVDALVKRMQAFDAKAPTQLQNFQALGRRYRDATAWMRAALQRQRSTAGDYRAGVARSQIAVAISQASIQAGSLHTQADAARSTFEGKADAVLRDVATAQGYCSAGTPDPLVVADAPGGELAGLSDACHALSAEVDEFTKNIVKVRRAFGQTDDVWQSERQRQEALLQESQQAQ